MEEERESSGKPRVTGRDEAGKKMRRERERERDNESEREEDRKTGNPERERDKMRIKMRRMTDSSNDTNRAEKKNIIDK